MAFKLYFYVNALCVYVLNKSFNAYIIEFEVQAYYRNPLIDLNKYLHVFLFHIQNTFNINEYKVTEK